MSGVSKSFEDKKSSLLGVECWRGVGTSQAREGETGARSKVRRAAG